MTQADEKEPVVNAYRGEGKARETREFTQTQWQHMGRDKAGWRPTAPEESTKSEAASDPATDEAALLNARERYETLFGRKAHHSSKLETIEAAITAELARQNKQGEGNKGSSAPPPPAAPPAPAPPVNTVDAAKGNNAPEGNNTADAAVAKAQGNADQADGDK